MSLHYFIISNKIGQSNKTALDGKKDMPMSFLRMKQSRERTARRNETREDQRQNLGIGNTDLELSDRTGSPLILLLY